MSSSITTDTKLDEKLHIACREGKIQEAKQLLEQGADVNARFDGVPPLYVASQAGVTELIQLLLDNGADIDAISNHGGTTIYYASCYGRDAVVDYLAFRGADVRKSSIARWTALIGAAYNGFAETVETLVDSGAEIDAVNNELETALMWIVKREKFDVARLLLSLNADTTKVDNTGKTAFQYAKSDRMTKMFLKHGSKSDEAKKQLAKETMTRIRHKVSIRFMRFAQDTIIGICLAFAPLELPPYVLLWIIDFLPNYYDKLSHHKKIELITSVRNSIWKLKRQN